MHEIPRLASGISGLDKVLAGGFITGASYIIQAGRAPGRPSSPTRLPARMSLAAGASSMSRSFRKATSACSSPWTRCPSSIAGSWAARSSM